MTTWVRTNPRPFLAVLIVVLLLGGGLLAVGSLWQVSWVRGIVVVCGILLAAYAGWLLWQLRLPRVAVSASELRLHLTPGRAISVPLEHVECFLLGQGPTHLGKAKTETATLSIRIAERATEYQQRWVLPMLASWCNGYVTIRGTWTEPLTVDLVRKLNSQLTQAKSVEPEPVKS